MGRRQVTRLMAILLMCATLRAQEPTFKVDSRLVELVATVIDKKGRHMPDLGEKDFELFEQGKPQPIERFERFESSGSGISIGVLLDTTGSMEDALPALKNSVSELIDQLRDADRVAIFGFSDRFVTLQEFTSDKRAAKLATRRIRAEGGTALFDAISRIAQRVSVRQGKKAIVVFTDGEDNSSVLNLEAAASRARKSGIPLYTICQGDALRSKRLIDTLERISAATGARSYQVKKSSEMQKVFAEICQELRHTYLLAFKPAPGRGEWRQVKVGVRARPAFRVRAREGYYAE